MKRRGRGRFGLLVDVTRRTRLVVRRHGGFLLPSLARSGRADTRLESDEDPLEDPIYVSPHAQQNAQDPAANLCDLDTDPDETPFDLDQRPEIAAVIELVERAEELRAGQQQRRLQRRIVPLVFAYVAFFELLGFGAFLLHPSFDLASYSAGVVAPPFVFAGTVLTYKAWKGRGRPKP